MAAAGLGSLAATAQPAILIQPQPLELLVGGAGSMAVAVDGQVTGFQWWKDGGPLDGATNISLAFSNVLAGHAGDYFVVVNDGAARATSAVARLTVRGTLVEGSLADQVWRKAEGPFVLRGGVSMSNLVVEAGVEVLGMTNASLTVGGSVAVQGTRQEPVTFRPRQAGERWAGLRLSGALLAGALSGMTIEGASDTGLTITGSHSAGGGPVQLVGCVFRDNQGVLGGGLYVTGDVTLEGCELVENSVRGLHIGGGGVFVRGETNVIIRDSLLRGNRAESFRVTNPQDHSAWGCGAYIEAANRLLMENCRLQGNTVSGAQCVGGGLASRSPKTQLRGTVIAENAAIGAGGRDDSNRNDSYGGGIYAANLLTSASGLLELDQCEVRGNLARSQVGSQGGGINTFELRASGSTISDNTCRTRDGDSAGGGVRCTSARLHGCLVNNNLAITEIRGRASRGGGISVNSAPFEAFATVFSGNQAASELPPAGGALHFEGGTAAAIIANCTFSQNPPESLRGYAGRITSSAFPDDSLNSDPTVSYSYLAAPHVGLGNLSADNGNLEFVPGTMFQHAPGSVAVDAGDPSTEASDLAFPPSHGGRRNDIGAYGGPYAGLIPGVGSRAPLITVSNRFAPSWAFYGEEAIEITMQRGSAGAVQEYTLEADLTDPDWLPVPVDGRVTISNLTMLHFGRAVSLRTQLGTNEAAVCGPIMIRLNPRPIVAGVRGGGRVSMQPKRNSYTEGEQILLEATPDQYWSFSGWSDGILSRSRTWKASADWVAPLAYFAREPHVESLLLPAFDIALGGDRDDDMSECVLLDGGRMLVIGTSISGESGSKRVSSGRDGLRHGWALMLERDGRILWQRAYGGGGDEWLTAVVVSSIDRTLIFAGHAAPGTELRKQPVLFKTDLAGSVLWRVSPEVSGSVEVTDVIELGNGSILVSGSHNNVPQLPSTILLEFTSTGKFARSNAFDYIDLNQSRSVFLIGRPLGYWWAGFLSERFFGTPPLVALELSGGISTRPTYHVGLDDQVMLSAWAPTDTGDLLLGARLSTSPGLILGRDAAFPKFQTITFASYDTNTITEVRAVVQLRRGDRLVAGNVGPTDSRDWTAFTVGDQLAEPPSEIRRFGGLADDSLLSAMEMPDGTLVFAGSSRSERSAGKGSDSLGGTDYWLVGLVPLDIPTGSPVALVNGRFASNHVVPEGAEVEISWFTNSPTARGEIYFSLDGREPEVPYTGPFKIRGPAQLRAAVFDSETLGQLVPEGPAVAVAVAHQYPLAEETPGGGMVDVSPEPPAGGYFSNAVVTLIATAQPGWVFTGWAGDAAGTNRTTEVVMNRAKGVRALFGTTNLTVSKFPSATAGAVQSRPESGPFIYGSQLRLEASPEDGRYLEKWRINGVESSDNPLTLTVTAATNTVVARFLTLPAGEAALKIGISGEGGVISSPPGNKHPMGTRVTNTAVAAAGWVFAGWTGDVAGAETNLVVVMDGSRRIVARFQEVDRAGRPPVATLTSLSGTSVMATNVIRLLVNVTDPDTNEFHVVRLLRDGAELAVRSEPPFEFLLSNTPPRLAPHAFQALVRDAGGLVATSDIVLVAVTARLPGITLLLPGAGTTHPSGEPLRLEARAIGWDVPVSNLTFHAIPGGGGTAIPLGPGVLRSGTLRDGIFERILASPPSGTYTLQAVVVDDLGMAGTDAVAGVRILPPDDRPWFRLSTNAVRVRETAGHAEVAIERFRGGPGQVLGRTVTEGVAGWAVPLNERGQGDFGALSNRFVLGDGTNSVQVRIPVADDPVHRGERHFDFVLEAPEEEAHLGPPSRVRVTIEDDETAPPDPLEQRLPPAAWPATGSLAFALEPAEAGGAWRFPWQDYWRQGDQEAAALAPGRWPVEFLPRAGYAEPAVLEVTVAAGANYKTLQYQPFTYAATGRLLVRLGFDGAPPSAGDGRWRSLSGSNGIWQAGGAVLSGLAPGPNAVQFLKVPGFETPPGRVVQIPAAPELTAVLSAYYGRLEPMNSALQLADGVLTTPPYCFTGQLVSEAGHASGLAVRPRVVLTAAHVLFAPGTTNRVPMLWWFFRRDERNYEPVPVKARDAYFPEQYLEELARAGGNPRDPKVREHDIAALFFDRDIAEGGYSGFLTAPAAAPQLWLTTPGNKSLAGYPLHPPDPLNVGRLHSIERTSIAFFPLAGATRVFRHATFAGSGGVSGGPLSLDTGGRAYPTAVYLGRDGLGDTAYGVFRVIDEAAAQLIERAELSAYDGQNHTGGGVILLRSLGDGGALALQRLEVRLEPEAVRAAGADWVVRQAGSTNRVRRQGDQVTLVAGLDYIVEFETATGWGRPADYRLRLPAGQDALLTATYDGAPPLLSAAAQTGIFLSGSAGRTVVVEHRAALDAATEWRPFLTTRPMPTAVLRSPALPGMASPPAISAPDGTNRNRVRQSLIQRLVSWDHQVSTGLVMIMMMLATTCATVGAGHDAEIAEIAGSTNITVHRWGRGQLFGQPREVAASINEKLLSGEVVKTGERTTARVVFMHSGEQVRLGEFSAIEIAPRDSPCASGLFRLLQGFGFFFRPRDSSEVFFCTPHALGGARGTEFEIRVDEEQGMTVISVQDGRVSVTNALGSAKVHSGQMVVINQTLPPRSFRLLPPTPCSGGFSILRSSTSMTLDPTLTSPSWRSQPQRGGRAT